jgi:integrase
MRVLLRGIDTAVKRLADGSTRTYHYAWRGGPRLEGKPGTPEFVASYNAAVAERPARRNGKTVEALVDAYLDSQDFATKRDRTREDYRKIARRIVTEFGDMPLSLLADKRVRGEFLQWRDNLAKRSRRQADYAWTVLALILSWAKGRGTIDINPCERGGKVYSATRADKVWREDDEAAFRSEASHALSLAFLLAVWTGQRQGDLLALTWTAYDGASIRLRQSKTGRYVVIPVGAPLKAALDAEPRRAVTIMTTQAGLTWTPDGFRASWGKAARKAGINGLTFHDLRGTAVLRLALAGCTVPEIATITGHSIRDVQSILDSNYFHRDVALAESGIRKLEQWAESGNKSPNQAPNRTARVGRDTA